MIIFLIASLILSQSGGVALLQADAVVLLGERLADQLELALVLGLRGEAGEDRVVGGQGVDAAGRPARRGTRSRCRTPAAARPGYLSLTFWAEVEPVTEQSFLPSRVSGPVIERVVGADQEVLAGDEVRAGEGDLLLALVGDRVGRDDEVDLAGRDAGSRAGRSAPATQVICRWRRAELLGDVLGDVDVEAGVLAALLQAEAGLVELDADLEAAGRRRWLRRPSRRRRCRSRTRRASSASAAAAAAAPIRRAFMVFLPEVVACGARVRRRLLVPVAWFSG